MTNDSSQGFLKNAEDAEAQRTAEKKKVVLTDLLLRDLCVFFSAMLSERRPSGCGKNRGYVYASLRNGRSLGCRDLVAFPTQLAA